MPTWKTNTRTHTRAVRTDVRWCIKSRAEHSTQWVPYPPTNSCSFKGSLYSFFIRRSKSDIQLDIYNIFLVKNGNRLAARTQKPISPEATWDTTSVEWTQPDQQWGHHFPSLILPEAAPPPPPAQANATPQAGVASLGAQVPEARGWFPPHTVAAKPRGVNTWRRVKQAPTAQLAQQTKSTKPPAATRLAWQSCWSLPELEWGIQIV